MTGQLLRIGSGMNIKIKTRIRYKGQEYSDANQLPPEVRAAYQDSMKSGSATKKIVFNGEEFANQSEMPADVRKLYDGVLSVIENNGEVTLPATRPSEPLITKRQMRMILVVVAAVLVAAAALAIAK